MTLYEVDYHDPTGWASYKRIEAKDAIEARQIFEAHYPDCTVVTVVDYNSAMAEYEARGRTDVQASSQEASWACLQCPRQHAGGTT